MGKRLIVAEKPSVGRDIANVLNCRKSEDGCRIGDNDIVTWAVGHLVGLCYPDEMDEKYKEWRLDDLPIFPDPFQLKVLESSKKQYDIVESLMNDPSVDRIVCATDAGREGELIFRYIYQMTGCRKPVDRLWISSLTYRAIKEGFEKLRPDSDYDALYESAKCRSEADWLIGMNGSRAYAIVNDMKMLSVGRVLSPTLAILVRRELERREFVPKEYCELVASFDGYDGKLICEEDSDLWSHFPVDQKEKLVQFSKDHSGTGTIVYCDSFEELQPPQQLYDLTSLQRDANRIYGMSSKRTLDMAQSLYERHKAITYPRTDSRYLSTDIRSTLPKRLESFKGTDLGQYADRALSLMDKCDLAGRFILNKGVSDHHAIIPTGEAKGMESWSAQEKQIYDLISRRFIGMFYPDRRVVFQTVKTSVDARLFLSKGEKEIESGWSSVDISRRSHMQALPDLEKGNKVTLKGMRVRSDQTKAPAPHTEASLLAAMEHAGKIVPEESGDDHETEYGIGTPATRAATIEKMIEKEMAVRKGRALLPTEYGIKLIKILPKLLQSPEMTGEWEARLARITKGKESADQFMADIRNVTKDIISCAEGQGDTGIKNAKSVGLCPLCGSPVREYENAYYCTNKNCSFRKIYKAVKGFHPTLQSITMIELLANGTADTEKGRYTIITEAPYIAFERSKKPDPDYEKLAALIEDYGLVPVDKVGSGGAIWIEGDSQDDLMRDFVKESGEIGCVFEYSKDSRALSHRSGWYHAVTEENLNAYLKAFGKTTSASSSESKREEVENSDAVLDVLRTSGFEYVDKRSNGGCLWFIADEEQGKVLAEKCRQMGVNFVYTAKGGKATKKRPGWYAK